MAESFIWPAHFVTLPHWDAKFCAGFLSFGAAMGSIFIFNQLEDIESDRRNNKLFLLGDGYISETNGWRFAWFLAAVSITLSMLVSLHMLLVNITFLVVSGYAYNYPPLECKNFPFRGLLANILMGGLAYFGGWAIAGPLNIEAVIAGIPVLGYNTALYLLTTLPDAAGDKDSDKVTIAVKLGFKVTLYVSLLLFALALVAAILLQNQLIFWLSVLLLPLGLNAIIRRSLSNAIVLLKMGILFFSIAVCIKFPLFLAMMIVAFVLSRWYYRRRFNYLYPTFSG